MPPKNQNCPLAPSKFHPSFFSYAPNGTITTWIPQCSPLCPHCRAFDAHWRLSENLSVNGWVDPMDSALSLRLEEQARQGLMDFKKSATSARKRASEYATKEAQTDCPRMVRAEGVVQVETQPTVGTSKGSTTEKKTQSTIFRVPKSTQTTNRVTKSASKGSQTKPVWVPPRADGHPGPARRRRLLLKFETGKGKVEYAELLDVIEMQDQDPKGKLKLKVNFKENTIRARYSVSGGATGSAEGAERAQAGGNEKDGLDHRFEKVESSNDGRNTRKNKVEKS